MISRQEIKALAKELAFKNKWKILMPMLLYGIVLMLLEAMFPGTTNIVNGTEVHYSSPIPGFVSLLLAFYVIGYMRYTLAIVRGETFELKDIFNYKSIFINALVLYILICLFTFLWMLLLIIPGIIAALSYSMTYYIMADDPAIEPMAAIRKSKEMMNGHKWEYFVLELSFIGWYLLGCITFGIGLIWAIPYNTITTAMYYEKLKEKTTV